MVLSPDRKRALTPQTRLWQQVEYALHPPVTRCFIASWTTPNLSQSGASSYTLSAMDRNVTALERAFELAKSGLCASVSDVKQCLKAEGYSTSAIVGRMLSRQLQELIAVARGKRDV
jgi:hypothetical protein